MKASAKAGAGRVQNGKGCGKGKGDAPLGVTARTSKLDDDSAGNLLRRWLSERTGEHVNTVDHILSVLPAAAIEVMKARGFVSVAGVSLEVEVNFRKRRAVVKAATSADFSKRAIAACVPPEFVD